MLTPKKESDLLAKEKEAYVKNTSALECLKCAMDDMELYNVIFEHESARDAWISLKEFCEGADSKEVNNHKCLTTTTPSKVITTIVNSTNDVASVKSCNGGGYLTKEHWDTLLKENADLKETIQKLILENKEKDVSIAKIEARLEVVEKGHLAAEDVLKKLGAQTEKLDEMLVIGRVEPGGHGFVDKGNKSSSSTVFVKANNVIDASCSKFNDVKHREKVCHHCGKAGHIRPHCFKLLKEQKR